MDIPALSDPPADRDDDVIARSIADPAYFAVLFDRHFATLHRYLARRAGSDAADDLASEVFTIAFARRAEFDLAYASALPWLYGIAGNLLHAHRRRLNRDVALAMRHPRTESPAPFDEAVDSALDARRDLKVLQRRLRRLSGDDLETLLLYAWEELSYPEIAEALGIPVGTVRSRLNRVRRKLREPETVEVASTGRESDE